MPTFQIEAFAASCKTAMASSANPLSTLAEQLRAAMDEHGHQDLIEALDASVPPGAGIGEMIVHLSPELTMLYARIPPRFQSGIHDHTVFACIGQLEGQEKNVFYQREGDGLRAAGERTLEAGEIIQLGSDVIHRIENPGSTPASALHLYAGDFQQLMPERHLWSQGDHQETAFSFEELLRQSVLTMHHDENEVGLAAMAEAIPKIKPMIDSLASRKA